MTDVTANAISARVCPGRFLFTEKSLDRQAIREYVILDGLTSVLRVTGFANEVHSSGSHWEPYLDIELFGNYDSQARQVDLTVRLFAPGYVPPNWDLRLFVVLMESNIYYGEKYYDQVMRDIIPYYFGDTLTIAEGQTKERNYVFNVDNQLEDTNCELVVFVQNYGSPKYVLQGAKSGLTELGPSGVSIGCENLTPIFCRGKNFYFTLVVNNGTSGDVSGTLNFTGYAGYDCDPGNVLASTSRVKTFGPGVTEHYYFFRVPDAAGPGQYSASVGGTLTGYEVFCCMNTDIRQCSPFRTGDNTEWELVEIDRPEAVLPTVTELHQNYPNPFNATTNVSYSLAEAGNVSLKVYDISGRLVATMVEDFQEAGEYTVTWEALDASSGIYFYKFNAGEWSETRRMSLIR